MDRNFVALLTGVAISFISLVAPIEFRGNHITLFWATEMVLLLFLYLRTKYQLLYSSSLIVVILMLVSLVNSWATVYLQNEAILPIIFNKGFITTIVAGLSLFIYYFLSKKIEPDSEAKPLDTNALKKIIFFLAILITYLSGLWETWFQFDSRFELEGLSSIYIQAYTFAFCILVLALFRKESLFPILKFILTSFCFALYLFLLGNNGTISQTLVEQNKHGLFIIHWLADILLLWLLYDLIVSFFKRKTGAWSEYSVAFTWLSAAAIILLLSIEMYQVILWSQFRKGEDWYWWENLYFKAGLTILWGICSFIMMWLGMRKNYRPLRIISLTLFTITLIKLFTYDIQKIPPGGKIAAFILLGILLLAVSFMYQRLKKIIIDNTTE